MPVCRRASLRKVSASGSGPRGASKIMKSLPSPCIFTKSICMRRGYLKCRPLSIEAQVHHDEHSRRARAFSRRFVDHTELQPQRFQPKANAILDDRGHGLRLAEHIDNIDRLASLERGLD